MRRRTLLRAGTASLALPALGTVTGRPPANDATEAYEPLGRLNFDDAREVVVDDAGAVAYVSATTHVASVDVSDPANPTKLDEVDIGTDHSDGPLRPIQDAKVDGDRLIAAGPPSSRGSDPWGFGLVDVSDPANMSEIAFVDTSGDHAIHNCSLDGDYAYLTGTTGLRGQERMRIYDVSDDAPEEVATWYPGDHDGAWDDVSVFLRNLHDITVQDGVAYLSCWDSGVFMVDVSDPTAPEYINRIGDHTIEELQDVSRDDLGTFFTEPPGNAHYAEVNDDGTILGEGGESWDTDPEAEGGGPSPITLYDISDPGNPEELATIETEETGNNTTGGWYSTSHNFEIRNDKLYSSWYSAGVKVHDISEPGSPERIAWYAKPDQMSFWTAQVGVPDEFFVATTYKGVPRPSRPDSALYTFPDGPGEMAEPPNFPAPDDGSGGETTTEDPTDLSGEETTAAPTTAMGDDVDETTAMGDDVDETTAMDDGVDETTAMDDDGDDGDDGDGDDGGSPGLGIVSALAGLGVGAWRLRKRGDDAD